MPSHESPAFERVAGGSRHEKANGLQDARCMPDQFRLARIGREQALRRLGEDRDIAAWTATTERLDREAHAANVPPVTAQSIAESLADLQSLYAMPSPRPSTSSCRRSLSRLRC
jgi:hypothetical protein